MPRLHRCFLEILCLSIVGLLVHVRAAHAQQKITLRGNLSPGMSWTFSEAEQMNMNTTVKVAGQEQKLQQRGQRKLSGKVEVLEAANGRATAMRVTFDRDCGGMMDNGMGQQMPMPFPLAGQTVNLKLDPTTGLVTNDARAQLDHDDQVHLNGFIEGDDAYLPTQPVGVGESWSPDTAVVAKKWGLDPMKNKIGLGLTLKDVRDVGGRQVALVDVAGEMMGEIGGMNGSRKLNGTTMIDVQTGRAIGVDVNGTMTLNGIRQQPDQAGQIMVMEVASEGTTSSKSQAQFTSAGGAGAGGMPGGFGGGGGQPPAGGGGFGGGFGGGQPPAGGGGFGGGGGGGAPAGAPPEGSFTFRDDKITFTFVSDPRQPQATGSITMGDQKFPVRVTAWNGRDIAGTFQASGADFNFTGKVDGDTLLFTTDGTNYTLKSVGPPPAPKKRNPLGQ